MAQMAFSKGWVIGIVYYPVLLEIVFDEEVVGWLVTGRPAGRWCLIFAETDAECRYLLFISLFDRGSNVDVPPSLTLLPSAIFPFRSTAGGQYIVHSACFDHKYQHRCQAP